MNESNKYTISLVIPCYENFNIFKKVFASVINQTQLPNEIIIIDSSISRNIEQYIKKFNLDFEIIYKRVIKFYPGKARNFGVSLSKYEYVAFLDSKTIAKINWLKEYINLIKKNNYDIIFGSTKFITSQFISRIFLSATYGNIIHQTTPGTLFLKEIFDDNFLFTEYTRSGEDIEWRERIINRKNLKYFYDNSNYSLTYDQISNNVFENLYKHFIYSFHTARLKIQRNLKNIYLSFFLILSALIIPKWNVLIGGWDQNPLFVPNITKLYLLTLIIILLSSVLYQNLLLKKKYYPVYIKIINIILFIFFSMFIFRYNSYISNYYYFTVWQIPHITKYYISLIIIISIVYRGLIQPIRRNIDLKYLFFYNWFFIGIAGLLIDIVKTPGFLIGSIISLLNVFNIKKISYNNLALIKKNKILFVCPFPFDVQAGQRLKYEQQFKTFKENNYEIEIASFINLNTWNILYKKGYFFKKLFSLLKGYIKRSFLLFKLKNYDIVYIFMWVVPYTGSIYENLYRKFSNKVIYDIEDNVLIIKTNIINPITSRFKSYNKYTNLIKKSDQIITSSPGLVTQCNNLNGKNNSTYICASINLERYKPNLNNNSNKKISIGWTGTFSSQYFLKIIEPYIQEISKIRNIEFIVIGDFKYKLEGVKVRSITWNKANEINDLSIIDIGMYPLEYEKWISGKSGLKALQYMAMSIPTIATNVGNVKNIIKDGISGFLVENNNEWLEKLKLLIDDKDLRIKIGANGRKVIENYYSNEMMGKKYLEVLSKVSIKN